MKKKYNSIEEVNQELRILNVQRELELYKVKRAFENLKEGITPNRLFMSSVGAVASSITRPKGIRTIILSAILNYIFRRKK